MAFPTVKKQFGSSQSLSGYMGDDFEHIVTVKTAASMKNTRVMILTDTPFFADITFPAPFIYPDFYTAADLMIQAAWYNSKKY